MEPFQIKTGFENMDTRAIHNFLSTESYWAKGIPLLTVELSLQNSFCIGIFHNDAQVAFARFVTDYATFAYLADVYVLQEYRGRGLSKLLMKHMMAQPWTEGLRRILLATTDAHWLYEQFGFDCPPNPDWLMELKRVDIYKNT